MKVALKILPRLVRRHADRRQRSEREARTLASLSQLLNLFLALIRVIHAIVDEKRIVLASQT